MNSVQAGVSYTLEVQKPDGAWTTGLASGWTECDEVPTRFIFNYKILSIDPDLEVMLDLEGAYKDTDTFVNFGLDYFSDFSYTDTGGGVHLFEIEGTWPYSGGLGTGTEVPGSSGIKNLRYVGEFHITSGTSGTLTIEWKSHLATSPNGASEWIGPPSANLQVSAEPRGLHGEKTVNIKKPDGSIFVSKTAEGEFLTDYYWTVEKTASPPGPIDLYVGGYQEINYTINVTRAEVENPYRMRGAITITNTYDHDICVDVLDQVEVGPYTPGDDPGTAIGTPTAKWTWNNQIVPANDQLVLYFPGLTASDWFEFDSGVSTSTTYYNIVWVAFNRGSTTCPSPDAGSADFSVGGSYEKVVTDFDSFTFTPIYSDDTSMTVEDFEYASGEITISDGPYYTFIDGPTDLTSHPHPWEIDVTDETGTWTFNITKEIECTGPGTGYLEDYVNVTCDCGDLIVRYPPEGNLTVTFNQQLQEDEIFVSKTAEGQILSGTFWTVEKTASPPGPIDLIVGETQDIKYTITVDRICDDIPQMRGAITITNSHPHDICVDVLDQVEVGPYTPGDDPGTAIGTPTAKWTWNNQIVPANDQLVLYFPGLTASDWFEFDSGVSTSTTYYNIVWVGFNEDLEVCPVPDATDPNTDFSVEGDYDNVISAYDDFIFDYIELEEYYEATVTDYESDCGNIEIKGDPIFDPPGHPWTVGSNGDEPWTFEIDKTIECTGPGTCYLGDWVEVTPIADSNLLARYPESGTLVVTFYQTASYDFGDAPDDPYPTYDSSTGAKHLIGDIWLGATVDGESEGQPLPPAYGDDNNGVDDEDGVVFPSLPYYVGTTGSVRITVSGSVDGNNPAYLHGWIDWNQDGDWGDPSENLFSGYIVTAPGIYQIDFPVPSDAVPGSTYARFRVDDEDLNSVTGEAGNGEVEDYLVDPAVAIIPPRRPVAVGGFLMPVDELTILAPYLAIMISAILMSSIIVLRKKYRN